MECCNPFFRVAMEEGFMFDSPTIAVASFRTALTMVVIPLVALVSSQMQILTTVIIVLKNLGFRPQSKD